MILAIIHANLFPPYYVAKCGQLLHFSQAFPFQKFLWTFIYNIATNNPDSITNKSRQSVITCWRWLLFITYSGWSESVNYCCSSPFWSCCKALHWRGWYVVSSVFFQSASAPSALFKSVLFVYYSLVTPCIVTTSHFTSSIVFASWWLFKLIL